MEWLDFYVLWIARAVALAWLIWGGLCLLDQPVTRILKWLKSYGLLCEFCFYRKRFKKWINAATLPRAGEDGKWVSERGFRDEEDTQEL